MRLDFLLLIAGIVVLALTQAVFAAEPTLTLLNEYVECGCGCCSGVEPVDLCLYKSKGDSLERVAHESRKNAPSAQTCASAGCASGVRYHYCD